MKSTKLPAVLLRPHGNSISMERALNQIREILTWNTNGMDDPEVGPKIAASIDDVELMLKAIER